jgi:regulator of cell morphogenesis and NO signaling
MQSDWPDLETSVADWLIEHPELLRLFEQLGLEYSCGGKSLETAACQAGLNPGQTLAELRRAAGGNGDLEP